MIEDSSPRWITEYIYKGVTVSRKELNELEFRTEYKYCINIIVMEGIQWVKGTWRKMYPQPLWLPPDPEPSCYNLFRKA